MPKKNAHGAADPAAEVLNRCRALAHDPSWEAVRRWKARHPGRLAVGYLPLYVPRPLIEALGCLPVALFGDQWIDPTVAPPLDGVRCPLPRSLVEMGHRGRLKPLDVVLFPSECSVVARLAGVWGRLFPLPYGTAFPLPDGHGPAARRRYVEEMKHIARALGVRGGRQLREPALRAAIRRENRRRAALAELDALRHGEPTRLTAAELYLAVRAGAALPAEEHAALLTELAEAARRRPAAPPQGLRVLLLGSTCERPPLALVPALEALGCTVVEDDAQPGLRWVEDAIDVAAEESALTALARASLAPVGAVACRLGGARSSAAAVVEETRAAQADAVVFAAASPCDASLRRRPDLEAALDDAGIPHARFDLEAGRPRLEVLGDPRGVFGASVERLAASV